MITCFYPLPTSMITCFHLHPTPTYYSLTTTTKVICLKSNFDHIIALLETTLKGFLNSEQKPKPFTRIYKSLMSWALISLFDSAVASFLTVVSLQPSCPFALRFSGYIRALIKQGLCMCFPSVKKAVIQHCHMAHNLTLSSHF